QGPAPPAQPGDPGAAPPAARPVRVAGGLRPRPHGRRPSPGGQGPPGRQRPPPEGRPPGVRRLLTPPPSAAAAGTGPTRRRGPVVPGPSPEGAAARSPSATGDRSDAPADPRLYGSMPDMAEEASGHADTRRPGALRTVLGLAAALFLTVFGNLIAAVLAVAYLV